MNDRKTAIVTGGSRGIGHAIAMELAKEGYALAILGTSPLDRVKENMEALKVHGNPAFYYQGDLGRKEEREAFLSNVLERYGRIDCLVNNAGVAPRVRMDLLETTEESFDYVMNINLKGTFFLTQQTAKIMKDQVKRGDPSEPVIINIASISSYTSSPSRGEYCISKAGMSMVTSLFADRLAEYGIRVYEIRPGIIETDMTSKVKDKYDKLISEGLTPIKRWGRPEDVAGAVSVLCSGKLGFSTGEVLNVDGGFHLRRL